jgi:hypothetical protein
MAEDKDKRANLGQEAVSVAKAGGNYLTGILGDAPQGLIALLFGDRLTSTCEKNPCSCA